MSKLLWPLRIDHSIPTNPRDELGSSLKPDGAFHFWTPGVLRVRPEIGYYVHDIGPERMLVFRNLVEEARLWDIPGVKRLYPDQPNVSVMAGDYSGIYRSVLWPMDDLPDALLPILDAFHRLVDEASASPRRVLTGRAQWCAANFSAREPLRIELTLRNKGTERISFQNPMGCPKGALQVYLLVSPVPSAEAETPDGQRIEITADVLSRPDEADPYAKPPRRELLALAPNQSTRFSATPSVYLSPGQYRAVLFFNTGEAINPDQSVPAGFVRGVLALDMPPLHIVHR